MGSPTPQVRAVFRISITERGRVNRQMATSSSAKDLAVQSMNPYGFGSSRYASKGGYCHFFPTMNYL